MEAGLAILYLRIPRQGLTATIGFILTVIGSVLVELGLGSKLFTTVTFVPVGMADVPVGMAEFFVCAGITLTIPFLCNSSTNARLRFLRRPAHFISAASFSLYVFHYPIIACLDLVFPKSTYLSMVGIEHFVLRIAICLAVVAVFYVIFERNTPVVKRYLNAKFSGSSYQKPENGVGGRSIERVRWFRILRGVRM